jgi:putative endonuclease
LELRLNRHNKGLVKSTARYKPWILVWVTEKSTRKEAMNLEKKLKNLSKERVKEFIKKYPWRS